MSLPAESPQHATPTPVNIAIEDAIALLHEAPDGTLATHSATLPGYPYATGVPYVTDAHHRPVLCISRLAEHTRNLLADQRASLFVAHPGAADVQAAPRLTLTGEVEPFEPPLDFLERYLRYQPGARELLVLDFIFVRLNPLQTRVIEGIGRMGWLSRDDWAALPVVTHSEEAALVSLANPRMPPDVRLLGIDCYGIDLVTRGQRARHRFAGGPLHADALAEAIEQVAPTLGA